ncbi:MAG TPA: hypothetical protein PJ982_06250, partial [Lacipirellulaceae bacterium]|nr:hypothetical protein [Lacipirellulaceae bacterium]
RGVYDVFINKQAPPERLPADGEVCAVVYTYSSQPHVKLDRVERRGNVLQVHYLMIAHGHLSNPRHLWVIPLGKLPAGEYEVELIRGPQEREAKEANDPRFPLVPAGLEQKAVCRPFRFSVE